MPQSGNLPDLFEVARDVPPDQRLAEAREAAWGRFKAAADGYLAGDGGKAARAFLMAVEAKFGAEVAERQRKELWAWA